MQCLLFKRLSVLPSIPSIFGHIPTFLWQLLAWEDLKVINIIGNYDGKWHYQEGQNEMNNTKSKINNQNLRFIYVPMRKLCAVVPSSNNIIIIFIDILCQYWSIKSLMENPQMHLHLTNLQWALWVNNTMWLWNEYWYVC